MNAATKALSDELEACWAARNPFDRFNSVILRRPPYWTKQKQICRLLNDPGVRRVQVPSGHMTGKSYLAGGIAKGWLALHPDGGVVIVAPSLEQLKRAVWTQVREARANSPLLRGVGRMSRQPLCLEYGENWKMIGLSGTKPEVLQGFHPRGPVLVIRDEASAINDPEIIKALQSLKPVKWLDLSNPLHPHGDFYETCLRARDDRTIRVVRIASTDGPDIKLARSPNGLADAGWLRDMILDYGANSQTYRVRVEGHFPNASADLLVPAFWLDLATTARHVAGGRRRLAIDLGLGRGGDDTVHVATDDNGMLGYHDSKFSDFDDSAEVAVTMCDMFGIAPEDVTYDAEGIGAEFGYRLAMRGLLGAQPYKGSWTSKDPRYEDSRDACHFAMRRRLDPTRGDDYGNPRPVFSIMPEFMTRLRRELREMTIETTPDGRSKVRDSKEVKKSLKHSPDFSVTLAQTWAFAA